MFKDTHKEISLSNKTPALTKNMNMNIWVVGTSNQLFVRGSFTETKLSTKKIVTGKSSFFPKDPFYTPHCICLNI